MAESSEGRAAEILARIADEVRPKLDQDSLRGGYDCCGCSSYERIVDDIEAIVQEVLGQPTVAEVGHG